MFGVEEVLPALSSAVDKTQFYTLYFYFFLLFFFFSQGSRGRNREHINRFMNTMHTQNKRRRPLNTNQSSE